MKAKTLFEKVWEKHIITSFNSEASLVFIDLHLVHEVTSPQAFDSLRINDRTVAHPELTLATIDHGVPTVDRSLGIKDPLSKKIPSKIFNWVTKLMTGVKIHDFNCGLKIYRKHVVDSLDIYGGRHRYIPALANQKRFKI